MPKIISCRQIHGYVCALMSNWKVFKLNEIMANNFLLLCSTIWYSFSFLVCACLQIRTQKAQNFYSFSLSLCCFYLSLLSFPPRKLFVFGVHQRFVRASCTRSLIHAWFYLNFISFLCQVIQGKFIQCAQQNFEREKNQNELHW